MGIQFISVKCPQCSANLQIENGRPFAFCTYCGTKVIINNENEHIYRTIDEAGIRQADTERMIRLKELELEAKERENSRKIMIVAYFIALIFVAIGAIICIFNALAGMWGIIIGFYIALFTFVKHDEKRKNNNRRERQ